MENKRKKIQPKKLEEDVESIEIDLSDIPIERSENYQNIYTNFANIGWTAWDVRISFGLIDDTGSGELRNVQQASILMSPQFAHTFLTLLGNSLKQWREKHVRPQPRQLKEEENNDK